MSCEHHDDTGGYKETSVDIRTNYRASFNTYTIRAGKGTLEWLVNNKTVRKTNAMLSTPMTTRLIFRTNFRDCDPGYMADASWELSHFKFTIGSGIFAPCK